MNKILLLAAALIVGCNNDEITTKEEAQTQQIEHKEKVGGIALTIDDGVSLPFLIDNLDIFDRYDAKATFYMSHYNESMNEDLLHLQSKGFEIGNHSRYHKDAVVEVEKNSVDQWLHSEVLNPLSRMIGSGIDVQTFAYPFGHYTAETNEALKPYFSHVRGFGGSGIGDYSEGLINDGYFYYGINVDSAWLDKLALISVMDRASETGETLVLGMHVISDEWINNYKITPADLEFIVKYASEIGLEFKLMRDL